MPFRISVSAAAVVLLAYLASSCGGGGGGGQQPGVAGPPGPGTPPPIAAIVEFDSEMTASEKQAVESALNALRSFSLDESATRWFPEIFGGNGPSNVLGYLDQRMNYILSTLTDPFDRLRIILPGAGESAGAAPIPLSIQPGTLAINIGSVFWPYYKKKLEPSIVQFQFNDRLLDIPSTRVGIIQIGREFLLTNVINRIATLVHEARHSDCTGGLLAPDLERIRNNEEKLDPTCGHSHVRCTRGDYALDPRPLCDAEPWGSFGVHAIFARAISEGCISCNESEKQVARQIFFDTILRLNFDFNDMVEGRLGPPDMSSSDKVVGTVPSPPPADFSGTYAGFERGLEGGTPFNTSLSLTLTQSGNQVTGDYTTDQGNGSIRCNASGKTLDCTVDPGSVCPSSANATLVEDRLIGTVSRPASESCLSLDATFEVVKQTAPPDPCAGQPDGTYCGPGSPTVCPPEGGVVSSQKCRQEKCINVEVACQPVNPCAGQPDGIYCGHGAPPVCPLEGGVLPSQECRQESCINVEVACPRLRPPEPPSPPVPPAPPVDSCAEIRNDIEQTLSGFSPQSSGHCKTDADCQLFTIEKIVGPDDSSGGACVVGCPQSMTQGQAGDWSSFLNSDPALQNACQRNLKLQCEVTKPSCEEEVRAACENNTCVTKPMEETPPEPPASECAVQPDGTPCEGSCFPASCETGCLETRVCQQGECSIGPSVSCPSPEEPEEEPEAEPEGE